MLRKILADRYAANLDYATRLVADLDDARSITNPCPGLNHPRWILGHLALVANAMTAKAILGLESELDPTWGDLFSGKSAPEVEDAAAAYPPLAILLAELQGTHAMVGEAILGAAPSVFERAIPASVPEGFRKRFPTVGSALLHTMVAHEMQHLGQLSAWRRASGLPRV